MLVIDLSEIKGEHGDPGQRTGMGASTGHLWASVRAHDMTAKERDQCIQSNKPTSTKADPYGGTVRDPTIPDSMSTGGAGPGRVRCTSQIPSQ